MTQLELLNMVLENGFYLRSEASKDWPPGDYPGDLCFFNWRFSRQIVEMEKRRLKGKGK